MFHLFTHAFFKSLLFLSAGSVMHGMGNVIDIRRFSGLRHVMPWTHRTFLVGCLALAGIFPFAGFWSKDQIVAAVHARAHPEPTHAQVSSQGLEGNAASTVTAAVVHSPQAPAGSAVAARQAKVYLWLYWCALGTAFLTAFYTFRAYFLTFFGPRQVPEEAGEHAHESPPVMCIPLVILALFAFGVGFVVESGGRFAEFLALSPSLAYLRPAGESHAGEFHIQIALVSTLVAGLGIALSAFLYLGHQREVQALAHRLGPVYRLSLRKFYLDEIYQGVIVWPLRALAWLSYACDRWLIDGLVDLCGRIPVWLGRGLRQWQTGLVPFYSLMMALGTILLLIVGRMFWGGG
jgi:NADH-quinone oxidoreductase subunit L